MVARREPAPLVARSVVCAAAFAIAPGSSPAATCSITARQDRTRASRPAAAPQRSESSTDFTAVASRSATDVSSQVVAVKRAPVVAGARATLPPVQSTSMAGT